jgi:hypothetical protein
MSDKPTETTEQDAPPSKGDPFAQSKKQALSPEQKHKNYLDDLKRLHKESVVDPLGNTPRAG